MEQENFSPQDSLKLIQSMITKTRQDMGDNSKHFLLWGWITFIACTAQFILIKTDFEKHYLVWLVVIIGIVFSVYQGQKEKKTIRVKTYVDESMKHLWAGMAISFFVLGMILTKLGWDTVVFPFFIMMYGLGTFVSGNMIRFTPLIIGGLIAWALAIGATFVSYDFQMLFGAMAILISYIIPAHLLRRRDKIVNR